jgi:multidrug resistance efflux pump
MSEPTTARPAPPANGELVNRVQQLRLNDQLGAGRSHGGATWLPWALCALMALAWAGVGIRAYRAGALSSAAPAGGESAASSSSGGTGGSSSAAGAIKLEYTGYLVPAQLIAVTPIDVGGRVVELNAVEGKRFPKGAVLARIDETSYKAQVAEAQASQAAAAKRLDAARMKLAGMLPGAVRPVEIAQAQAELKEAEALRDRAKDQFERFERVTDGVSQQEKRQARFDHLAAEARAGRLAASLTILKEGPRQEQKAAAEADVKAAEAEVGMADARLVQARWRLENCAIKAPIDGTVLTKKAELGNLVNPMAFSASTSGGGAVCDMANLADLEADLKVPEREISKVAVGQRCQVRAKAFPDRVYEGRLDRIMPTANRGDNTVNVRVKVKLPDGEVPGTFLKPEMGADVSFLADGPAKP